MRPLRLARAVVAALAAAAALSALASCQVFVSTEPGAGVGSACRKDIDCQASECISGVCAIPCEAGGDECPEGTLCTSAQLCQLPMRIASFYPGGAGQDWTLAHDDGFKAAANALAYLTEVETTSNVATPDAAAAAAADAVSRGFDAVFAASSDWNGAMIGLAQQHPGVQFFTAGGGGGPGNHHGYYARLYKAWYLAGAAAAHVEPAPTRLGVVGSYVTPAVVRHINAFVRGARSVNDAIVTEVAWMHEWVDSTPTPVASDRELALALVANGATVIAYHGYSRIAAEAIAAEPAGTWVIGNNYGLACDGNPRCLGTVYWTWGPLYSRLIDQAHSASLGPNAGANDDIHVDPAQSVPNFAVHVDTLKEASDVLRAELAAEGGVGRPFAGPFCWTDGSPCVEAGQTLTDGDLASMCKFVDGLVTRVGADDEPALVPPEGDCTPAE
ncbi:MAG: BMP family ABC transporter substrate-binding protein [Polyangiaceae bacterium]